MGRDALKKSIDLVELVELVDLPDDLFQWSLDPATGEIHPGPDDGRLLVPLPTLSAEQVLRWMAAYAYQATDTRVQSLLAVALKYPAPERRFREVLSVNPQARSDWELYFDQQRRAILADWLHSLGFDAGPDDDV